MLYDSHAHLNHEDFSPEDRESWFAEIESSAELAYVNDIGFDLQSSKLAIDHAQRFPWCYAVVGYHPHNAEEMDDMQLALIKGLAKKQKVKAIGEIGLDFYYDHSPRDVQRKWFREQIRMANELKMPIVIHSRDAEEETMTILKEEGAFSEQRKSWFPERKVSEAEGFDGTAKDARVLIHCFSGSRETARQYVKLGATISIAGPVTYKNAVKTVEVVRTIPIEYLLVETDAPFLTPEPHRGKKNRPVFVEHTARRIAVIKDMEYEEIAQTTCRNAKIFFDVDA